MCVTLFFCRRPPAYITHKWTSAPRLEICPQPSVLYARSDRGLGELLVLSSGCFFFGNYEKRTVFWIWHITRYNRLVVQEVCSEAINHMFGVLLLAKLKILLDSKLGHWLYATEWSHTVVNLWQRVKTIMALFCLCNFLFYSHEFNSCNVIRVLNYYSVTHTKAGAKWDIPSPRV